MAYANKYTVFSVKLRLRISTLKHRPLPLNNWLHKTPTTTPVTITLVVTTLDMTTERARLSTKVKTRRTMRKMMERRLMPQVLRIRTLSLS